MKAIIRQGTLADKIILVMLECGIISGRAERIIYIPSLRSTVSKTIGYLVSVTSSARMQKNKKMSYCIKSL